MIKAIFINLDNCLIETKSGRKYPLHREDWRFKDEVFIYLSKLNIKDFKLIIISNQTDIERGILSEEAFIDKINTICNKLEFILKLKKNSVSYFYCTENNTYNTIPNPGMILEAGLEYEIDFYNSVIIGNNNNLKQLHKNSGIRTYIDIIDIID